MQQAQAVIGVDLGDSYSYRFCQNWCTTDSERTLHLPGSPETPDYTPPTAAIPLTAAINARVLLK